MIYLLNSLIHFLITKHTHSFLILSTFTEHVLCCLSPGVQTDGFHPPWSRTSRERKAPGEEETEKPPARGRSWPRRRARPTRGACGGAGAAGLQMARSAQPGAGGGGGSSFVGRVTCVTSTVSFLHRASTLGEARGSLPTWRVSTGWPVPFQHTHLRR